MIFNAQVSSMKAVAVHKFNSFIFTVLFKSRTSFSVKLVPVMITLENMLTAIPQTHGFETFTIFSPKLSRTVLQNSKQQRREKAREAIYTPTQG